MLEPSERDRLKAQFAEVTTRSKNLKDTDVHNDCYITKFQWDDAVFNDYCDYQVTVEDDWNAIEKLLDEFKQATCVPDFAIEKFLICGLDTW